MNRSAPVAIVVLLVAISIVGFGVPVVDADASDDGSDRGSQTPVEAGIDTGPATVAALDSTNPSQDFDQTTFEITVHENGSATWTLRHEQHFGTGDADADDQRAAFEAFADEFESEESELYDRFTDTTAPGLVEAGAELTDREMEAKNFNRSATVEEQFGTRGIVEMSFLWTEFGAVEDDTIDVGDVFEDLYLGPSQAIVIEADDGLTFDTVEPESQAQYPHDSIQATDSVRWSGEQQFLDGHPRAVLVTSDADGSDDGVLPSPSPASLALGAVAVLGIAGVVAWYRRGGVDATRGGDDAGTATQPTAATAATEDHDGDTTSTADPLTDEELLTDEDRVVSLIRENGGRMKQVKIVEETGWSKSKVSMLLSDMEEEGTISKLRVGRENIISLEGYEPEATKSPFDE